METGSNSEQEPRNYGIVMVNRYLKKLFEEPIGQRRLPELLTAFSENEVEMMRAVPEVELIHYKDSTWLGVLEIGFAEAKGISIKSLYNLANRIGTFSATKHPGKSIKEVQVIIDDEFKNADFRQKCRFLVEMKVFLKDIFFAVEASNKINGEPVKYYENLFHEMSYRYALYFFEILLLLNQEV